MKAKKSLAVTMLAISIVQNKTKTLLCISEKNKPAHVCMMIAFAAFQFAPETNTQQQINSLTNITQTTIHIRVALMFRATVAQRAVSVTRRRVCRAARARRRSFARETQRRLA